MKINIHNTLKDLNFNGENVLLKSKSSFFIDLFFCFGEKYLLLFTV